jgi:hypothetical protein
MTDYEKKLEEHIEKLEKFIEAIPFRKIVKVELATEIILYYIGVRQVATIEKANHFNGKLNPPTLIFTDRSATHYPMKSIEDGENAIQEFYGIYSIETKPYDAMVK